MGKEVKERMDTFTLVIVVILILALIFFGVTILGGSSGSSRASTSGYAPSYAGGGCGR